MLSLPAARRRRRPSLTPMIDVVFLLLVFFMLAARFGLPQSLPIALSSGGSAYSGPPRLIVVQPDALILNGAPIRADALPDALAALTDSPSDSILLRPTDATDVQRLIDVITLLRAQGFTSLAVLESAP